MKYERFEDTPVWQVAADLAAEVFDWTDDSVFRGKGDLADQLQRSALSVSNNIAEGFERGTTNELLQFLYYARGSAGEVRSMLQVMKRTRHFRSLHGQIAGFLAGSESISRQLRGWANSLQNSDIPGQRYLNDDSRRSYENVQRRQAFERQLAVFRQDLQERVEREARERRAEAEGGEGE